MYEFGRPDTIRVASKIPGEDSIKTLSYPMNNTKKCWLESGHDEVNLNHAIYGSCNYYFYDSVIKDYNDIYRYKWEYWMKKLGFGKKTGVDLYYESSASIDKYENRKSDMLNMVIGQNLEVTPIQVAQMINLIANNGKIITPHLNKKSKKVEEVDLKLKKTTIAHIKKSMRDAVYNYNRQGSLKNRGTAWRSLYDENGQRWTDLEQKIKNISIYAKTGTAQTGKDYKKQLIDKKGNKYDNPNYLKNKEPNAWYAGYMDYGKYSASVIVMIENGGKGGNRSAEIAEKIFKKIIELNKNYGYYQ